MTCVQGKVKVGKHPEAVLVSCDYRDNIGQRGATRHRLLNDAPAQSECSHLPAHTHHAWVLSHGVEPLERRDSHAQEAARGVLLGGVELLLLAACVRREVRPGVGIGAAGLDLVDIM